jgi:hypothetical protein
MAFIWLLRVGARPLIDDTPFAEKRITGDNSHGTPVRCPKGDEGLAIFSLPPQRGRDLNSRTINQTAALPIHAPAHFAAGVSKGGEPFFSNTGIMVEIQKRLSAF